MFVTCDQQGNRSQAFRTLFMQELIRRGVIAPSFVVSFSHSDADIIRGYTLIRTSLDRDAAHSDYQTVI